MIAHLMWADFLERIRRYSFLVTMIASVYLGYAVYAGYIVMHVGVYRGIYNSVWIGTLAAASTVLFISMIGFYIVKNTLSRDRETRVGQILASTPVKKFAYLLGKVFSNFLVLGTIVLIQAIASVIMVLLSKESPDADIVALILPFLFITLPAIAFVAAAAVLFESVNWLRGGFGNVLYFFLWATLLVIPFEANLPEFDITCLIQIETSMKSDALASYPDFQGGFSLNAGPRRSFEGFKIFRWNGIRWAPNLIRQRLAFFGYSLFLILLAVPFFDRFDETRRKARAVRSKEIKILNDATDEIKQVKTIPSRMYSALFRILNIIPSSRFSALLFAELKLMVKGLYLAWYIIALALFIASIASPLDVVKSYLLPIIWLLPVLIWSKMGMREAYYGTVQLLFSAPRVRTYQLSAVFIAGVILTLCIGIGAGARLMLAGNWEALFGFSIAVIFIPSLALAFGVWSNTSKLFEAVYTIWWYIGPLNKVPELDFTDMSSSFSIIGSYLVFTLILLFAAYMGRRRQSYF